MTDNRQPNGKYRNLVDQYVLLGVASMVLLACWLLRERYSDFSTAIRENSSSIVELRLAMEVAKQERQALRDAIIRLERLERRQRKNLEQAEPDQ